MEEHVIEEVGKQLDYYVDAYRKVHDLDLRIASLSEEMGVLTVERADAEKLRDQAADAVNVLVENVSDEDEEKVRNLVNEKLSPLIGLMVL